MSNAFVNNFSTKNILFRPIMVSSPKNGVCIIRHTGHTVSCVKTARPDPVAIPDLFLSTRVLCKMYDPGPEFPKIALTGLYFGIPDASLSRLSENRLVMNEFTCHQLNYLKSP